MSTTQPNPPNPLFTRSEKGRFGRTMKKRARGAARKGLSKIFGIPLSAGLGGKTSRRGAHRTTAPARGSGPSTPVRSDVIQALKGQGYSAAVAKKMAEGVRADDTFEAGFRRVISRNPAELIIFGNPSKIYSLKQVSRVKRAGNPIPAALLTAFESAAGGKLFDAVTSGKKKNTEPRDYKGERAAEVLKVRRALKAAGYNARVKHGTGTAHNWLEIKIDGHVFTGALHTKIMEIAKRESGRTFGAAEHISVDFDLRRPNRTKKNPAGAGTDRAAELFETFHHRKPEGVFELQTSAKSRKDYTILGPLVALGIDAPKFDKIKPWPDDVVQHWEKLPHAGFLTPLQVDQVKRILGDPQQYITQLALLASSPNGKQLYVISEEPLEINISQFDTDTKKDLVDLGECTFVVYIAKKPQEPVEWVHTFGEEGGPRPRLVFDKLTQQILMVGGSYRVEAAGIIN